MKLNEATSLSHLVGHIEGMHCVIIPLYYSQLGLVLRGDHVPVHGCRKMVATGGGGGGGGGGTGGQGEGGNPFILLQKMTNTMGNKKIGVFR